MGQAEVRLPSDRLLGSSLEQTGDERDLPLNAGVSVMDVSALDGAVCFDAAQGRFSGLQGPEALAVSEQPLSGTAWTGRSACRTSSGLGKHKQLGDALSPMETEPINGTVPDIYPLEGVWRDWSEGHDTPNDPDSAFWGLPTRSCRKYLIKIECKLEGGKINYYKQKDRVEQAGVFRREHPLPA